MKHNIFISTLQASDYANLVLLNRCYSAQERRRWSKSRHSFLQEELKKHGKLVCAYCGRDDLKINDKKFTVTVDHIQAKSTGGSEFNHDNFAVSCSACNRKKGSTKESDFISSKYLTDRKKHIKKEA